MDRLEASELELLQMKVARHVGVTPGNLNRINRNLPFSLVALTCDILFFFFFFFQMAYGATCEKYRNLAYSTPMPNSFHILYYFVPHPMPCRQMGNMKYPEKLRVNEIRLLV